MVSFVAVGLIIGSTTLLPSRWGSAWTLAVVAAIVGVLLVVCWRTGTSPGGEREWQAFHGERGADRAKHEWLVDGRATQHEPSVAEAVRQFNRRSRRRGD